MGKVNENEAYNNTFNSADIKSLLEGNNIPVPISQRSLKRLYESSIHDYTKSFDKPKTALEVDGEIWGTQGNFSVISGKAKSRKTFLLSAVVPALLDSRKKLGHLRGTLPPDKSRILYFDTEQSPYHVQLVVERSLKLAGLSKNSAINNLKVFGLRPRNVAERVEIINYGIENETGIGAVIIDGIRDCVNNINDSFEANDFISKLMKWSSVKNIHIITVLHQNKNDSNMRGHLGSEALNKCETHVKVFLLNKDISKVEFDDARNKYPESFAFRIDKDGLPTEAELTNEQKSTSKNRPAESIPTEEYAKGLDYAFRDTDSLNSGNLTERLAKHFSIGISAAKPYVTHCSESMNLLEKSRGPRNSIIYRRVISLVSLLMGLYI